MLIIFPGMLPIKEHSPVNFLCSSVVKYPQPIAKSNHVSVSPFLHHNPRVCLQNVQGNAFCPSFLQVKPSATLPLTCVVAWTNFVCPCVQNTRLPSLSPARPVPARTDLSGWRTDSSGRARLFWRWQEPLRYRYNKSLPACCRAGRLNSNRLKKWKFLC